MKKYFLLLSVAALAFTAVSCWEDNPDEEEDFNTPGIEIAVDAKSSTTSSTDLCGLSGQKNVSTQSDGGFVADVPLKGKLQSEVALKQGELVPINGELELPAEDVPEIAMLDAGEFSNAGIVLTIKNPAPNPVDFVADLEVDSKNVTLPAVKIPAGKTVKIAYMSDDDDLPADYDEKVVLSDNPFKGKFQKIKLTNAGVKANSTKAPEYASSKYTYNVEAKYCVPIAFKAGASTTVHIKFSDLDFDLSQIQNREMHEYIIKLGVTSTVPFDISLRATGNNDLEALTDNAIQAGKIGAPKSTTVKLKVKNPSGEKMLRLNSADLYVTLKAVEDGAMLNKNQSLTFDIQSLTITKN